MGDDAFGATWSRYTTAYPLAEGRSVDHFELGPGLPASLDHRLIGDVAGRRILDLGCGMGHGAVALARHGAKVIAVDPDAAQLARARELAEDFGVRLELHEADLADLAFLRSASLDLVVSAYALAGIDDLDRVFRQVHRVLQPEAPLLISLPHPFRTLVRAAGDGTLRVERPFGSTGPLGQGPTQTHPHHFAGLHTSLARANFRLDVALEPDGSAAADTDPLSGWIPSTLILRARKEGL